MVTSKNVNKTVAMDLCVSCGICKVSCPKGIIDLVYSNGQYHPNISAGCSECGVCIAVCPGIEINYKYLYNIKTINNIEDVLMGTVLKSYVCYAKNTHIRSISTSGGMITALIVQLLETGDYSGAFVLKSDGSDTSLAKVTYSNDLNEIISAAKSKYIPASVENAIKHVANIHDPVIIVGTPCQIHGIKKYLAYFKISDSHILYLGLFCDKTLNYNFLKFYKKKYQKGRKILKFDFRNKDSNNWPGDTKLTFTNGEQLVINRNIRINLKKYFQLNRCLFCLDKFNQLADISFGDCYIPDKKSKLGNSNILVRTEKGINIIKNHAQIFNMEEIDPVLIFSSQELNKKKVNYLNACLLAKKTGHYMYPDLDIELLEPDIYVKRALKKSQKILSYGKKQDSFNLINMMLAYDRLRNYGGKMIKKLIGAN